MMGIFSVVVAILGFGLLILIHEFGHFMVAKKCGITVTEFSIGMGPKLFSKEWHGTFYSLRLLPIGGFVSMPGEEGEEENQEEQPLTPKEKAGLFANHPVWQRALVIVAGAFMNVLLGFVLCVVITMMSPGIASMQIGSFTSDAVSVQKLQKDDILYSINENRVRTELDLSYALQKVEGDSAAVVVIRDGQKVDLGAVPFGVAVDEESGTRFLRPDFQVYPLAKTPLHILGQGWNYSWSLFKITWLSLRDLVTGTVGINNISGPVGATQQIAKSVSMGLRTFLTMLAMLTVNIGLLNILPFPALDGGRLAFLFIEAVRGRPVSTKVQGYVNLAGFAALMIVMVVVFFGDIGRIMGI